MATNQNRFTRQIPQQKLIADYMCEINAVVRAMKHTNFKEILADIKDYSTKLASISQRDALATIAKASKKKFILSTAEMTPYSTRLFYTAHIAAFCNLFREKTLKQSEFNADCFAKLALNTISLPENINNSQQTYTLLHTMDGIRTMQLLRLAGLVQRPSHEMLQLALGVGSALKDIHYLHAFPHLVIHHGSEDDIYEFNIERFPVGHIIVSDSDPRYKAHFEAFSENDIPSVLAFNLDTEKTFQALHNRPLTKRNLVTLIRVDHHMIPDANLFLRQLTPFIDDDCDFIISIGSGDTIDEYRGRTKLMKSMFELLKKTTLQPVLFKLHGSGTLEKQWSSLRFGSASASTYQILHCKLNGNLLNEYFNQ